MAKYGGYPEAARNRAKAALKHKEEKGTSCGTSVGWTRARQLSSNAKLDLSTVKRTFSFLSRAKTYDQGKFTDEKGKDICGSIMYAAWGGDSMKSWCESTINKAEKESRAEKSGVGPTLKKKAEDHNESVDASYKKTSQSTLQTVYNRGIGAYKTNPESVRPSVKSSQQWAFARVNSYLYALKNEKFRSGKHDTDLFPKGHKLSSK
jgi:hypothetical protein